MSQSALAPVPRAVRVYLVIVALFTLYVTFWGLFFPKGLPVQLPGFAKGFDDALPFNIQVPPLHARFIGSLYGAATVYLALMAARAKGWSDLWMNATMIFVWTGALGVVSFLRLDIFDWARPPVWAWFFAYIAFPLAAAWLLVRHRTSPTAGTGAPLSLLVKRFFSVQGVLVSALSAMLFLLPSVMQSVWPWPITPVLSQIYSAPLLGYGVCSLLVARARAWSEVRGFVVAEWVFAAGTLVASLIHRSVFIYARPSSWIWFGCFAGLLIVLGTFATRSMLREGAPNQA